MGKRENPHSDQDERERESERERRVVAARIFSASSALPSFLLPSRRLPVHHYRHQRGGEEKAEEGAELGLWVELPVVW